METDVILLLLRILSGMLLVGLMLTMIYVIWHEYNSTLQQLAANRRVYGQLISLQEIDGQFVALGETYPLRPLTSLGRAPTNHVVIQDSFASGEHAQIVLRNGQWWLEDRRSRNGTTLNELPIAGATIMTDGDIIGIGNRRYKLELNH